ncbi:MAG: addiction module protein [Pirellulaceae bacterium]
MTATLDNVLEAAMQLTDLERSQLVDALLVSVPGRFSPGAPLTRAELDERWAAYQQGGGQGLTWEEVRSRSRERAGIHD